VLRNEQEMIKSEPKIQNRMTARGADGIEKAVV
jgi:hypothetical protein